MNSERFADADMLALLKLANHLHDLPSNPIVRHEWMLDALCKLVGASVGMSALLDAPPRQTPAVLFFVYHGLESAQQQLTMYRYLRALDSPPHAHDPLSRLMESRAWEMKSLPDARGRPLNGAAQALHDVDELCKSLNVGPGFISTLQLHGTPLISLLTVHRSQAETQPFTARQRRLVELFHSQVGWTFRSQLPVELGAAAALSPRQQQTLRHLLAGDSEKQIAHKLSRSRHTVHTYVKAIYRNFRVSSRGELLSLFVK